MSERLKQINNWPELAQQGVAPSSSALLST